MNALDPAHILPADFLLVQVVTKTKLPEFFADIDRPGYVPETVFAIFPAHIISVTMSGNWHHYALVQFGDNLGEMFAQIAHDHKLSQS